MKGLEKNVFIYRYALVLVVVLIVISLIVICSVDIIFNEGDYWKSKVSSPVKVELYGERGNIYSSDGQLLAATVPEFGLSFDFFSRGFREDTLIAHIDRVSMLLSSVVKDKSANEYKKLLLSRAKKRSKTFRPTRRYISYSDLQKILSDPYFKRSPSKSGFIHDKRYRREKPYGILASRTIGNISSVDNSGGRSGLELSMNKELQGAPGYGYRQIMVGRPITTTIEAPSNGANVITTIDVNIQNITQRALMERVKQLDADMGCAIVMEVKTGAIKAIANLGRTSSDKALYDETVNYAIGAAEQPGSTIKTASFLIGIDDGVINLNQTIDCEGGKVVRGGRTIRDHNYGKNGFNVVPIPEIFYHSSNVGTLKLIEQGYLRRPQFYRDRLDQIGLTIDLNLPLPEARKVFIPSPSAKGHYWSGTTLQSISYGYETKITPIQMLSFFNAIANNGEFVRPQLIQRIEKEGEIVKEYKREVLIPSIAKPSTIKQVQSLLEGVVEKGTGKRIALPYMKIAGKTGTAYITKGEDSYIETYPKPERQTFCGYFPADNPQYSCIVLMRYPKNSATGTSSGWVFRTIAERIYALSMYKSTEELRVAAPVRPLDSLTEDQIKELAESGKVSGIVPDLSSLALKDAVYVLEECGLNVTVKGKGRVVKQSLAPGSTYHPGQKVEIELSL